MSEKHHGFWSSLQGIITAVATLITAITGLYIALGNNEPLSQTASANTPSRETPSPIAAETQPTKPSPHESAPTTTTPAVTARLPKITVDRAITKTASEKKPFPASGKLVDCSQFPTVNTIRSLMSWSDHYHKQIIAAANATRAAPHACNKTIEYRGMAHCKAPENTQIRQDLLETLELCRKIGIEWTDIKHTEILNKKTS